MPIPISLNSLPLTLDTTAAAPVPLVLELSKLILSPTLYPLPGEYIWIESILEESVLVTVNSCLCFLSVFAIKS